MTYMQKSGFLDANGSFVYEGDLVEDEFGRQGYMLECLQDGDALVDFKFYKTPMYAKRLIASPSYEWVKWHRLVGIINTSKENKND